MKAHKPTIRVSGPGFSHTVLGVKYSAPSLRYGEAGVAGTSSLSANRPLLHCIVFCRGWCSEGRQQRDPNNCFGFSNISARRTSSNLVFQLLKVWVLLATDECQPPAVRLFRHGASGLANSSEIFKFLIQNWAQRIYNA